MYLSLEMKLAKVHGILIFKESNWLKNALILIQTKEKIVVNSLEKDFLTLMIKRVMAKQ